MLKSPHFLYHACTAFHMKWLIRSEGSREYIGALLFSCSDTRLKRKVQHIWFFILYPIGSVPQFCRDRSEDVTKPFNKILLPIVVQVYGFHGKLKKLKKTKLWVAIEIKKKKQIKLYKKLYKEIIRHTAEAHSEPSQTSNKEPFEKMINYFRKKLRLRGCLYQDFKPGMKFQLIKLWWGFISHGKWQ